MATITPSTFDPLLGYVNVRLQQGVPILDADWNELDDRRQFELRSFLRWYVGDGVADGNDAFRIEADGSPDDVWVRAGAPPAPVGVTPTVRALAHAGRCLVDGLDVLIPADVRFTGQPLHASQAGAAALAASLGVPVVAALPGGGPVLVYLDVWERALTADDEPTLVLPGLGVETCARVRREWAVRGRPGTVVPVAGDADHLAGHHYLALAAVDRSAGVPAVIDADVRDRRQRRLLLPPAHLLTDTLGVDPVAYRRGEDRPPISLREAVNALLAGELPATADLPVSPAAGVDVARRGVAVDGGGGLVVVWQSQRVGGTNQVVASRLDLDAVAAGFSAAQVLTTASAHLSPTAVAVGGADLVVAYQTGPAGNPATDVVMKRGSFGGLAGAAEQPVAATAGGADERPFAVVVDNLVVVLTYQRSTSTWRYTRYRHTDGVLLDTPPALLVAGASPTSDLHAEAAAGGTLWCAFVDGPAVQVLRLVPSTGAIDAAATFAAPGASGVFVVAESATAAQVYWTRSGGGSPGLQEARFSGAAWGAAASLPATVAGDTEPAAVVDASGRTWLFFTRPVTGAGTEVFVRTRNPVTGDWSEPRRVISGLGAEQAPHALLVDGQGIWVLWASDRLGTFDQFAKRIVTAI